jgi:hypothetical protein
MTSSRIDQNLLENAKTLTQSLVISDDNLRKIMFLLESEFKKGLKGDEKAVVRMFITYNTWKYLTMKIQTSITFYWISQF